MEENGTEGSQQASNVVSFSTKQLQQLLDGDKADGSSCSVDPEKINGTRGPDSPVSLGYGSVDSGTPKSSVSPDSDANPSSPKKLLKMPQVDVTDACRMSQYNIMTSSCVEMEVDIPVDWDASEYNMQHKRRGRAVIFNHDTFDTEHYAPREGSKIDVKNLCETFSSLLFDVTVHDNLEYSEIKHIVSKLAEEDHSDADCLLLTVLTHGEFSQYLHACDCLYSIENLWLPFTADKCRSLAGKPKLFIIQACRGEKVDPGVTLKARKRRRTETDSIHTSYKIPTHADFLIAYSSVEGFSSWRNPDKGTWFIQCLCRELQGHAATKDFLKILTQTSRRVAIDHESYDDTIPWQHQQKQVPSFNSMLIRDLYFRPKI